jgi:hypothetical protein
MNLLAKQIFSLCVLVAVFWLLAFVSNPYSFCKDHPDAELRSHYWLCEPFGFDFPRGVLEAKRKTDFSQIFGNNRTYAPPVNSREFEETRKRELCSDPAFRRTEHGKEVCGE